MPKQRSEAFFTDMVDAINGLYGAHPGRRAVHAKGIYLKGSFRSTAAGAAHSRARHLQTGDTPVTARFSNGSGLPLAPDADPDARGLAVKFHLPEGKSTDLVSITIPAFPVKTPEDFVEFTRARSPLPETGKPDQARVGAFVAKHPETQRVLGLMGAAPPPTSYATSSFNSIHTFMLTNSKGVTTPARYRVVPVGAAPRPIDAASANAFQDDVRARLSAGPLHFDLIYILAGAGDDLLDPTTPWPAGRTEVNCGRLSLSEVLEVPAGPDDTHIFDPTNVTDGIACSEDEILHARSGAYSVSYARRTRR